MPDNSDIEIEATVMQICVDRLMKKGVTPREAFETVRDRMKEFCYVDWLAIDFDEESGKVSFFELPGESVRQ